MEPLADSSQEPADLEPVGVRVAIIYEDRETGLRAKSFADRLVAAHACPRRSTDSLWRCELLEFPSIADEAARDAAGCEFIIVSLRGDDAIPFATRNWLGAALAEADSRGAVLVALFCPIRSDWRAVEGARHFFRALCAEKVVPFFSSVVTLSGAPKTASPASSEDMILLPQFGSGRRAVPEVA